MTENQLLKLDIDGKLDLTVADFVGRRIMVLGSSGSGKSNSVALLLENLLPYLATVIFDVHDEYWGLCEQYPLLRVGKSPDCQIQAGAAQAAAIAELSYKKRLSVLVEMLYMKPSERLEFVAAFCERLWELSKKHRMPYGVVMDEAHNFIPEGKSITPALESLQQFASEGRKFGFTVILSSQRTTKINKEVLSQCEIAFLHGVNIRNDIDAYASMLPFKGVDVRKMALALERGECIFKTIHKGKTQFLAVKMLKRKTFHVADTPTTSTATPTLRAIDAALLAELQTALADKPAPIAPSAKLDTLPGIPHDQHIDSYIAELHRLIGEKDAEIAKLKALHKPLPPLPTRGPLPALRPVDVRGTGGVTPASSPPSGTAGSGLSTNIQSGTAKAVPSVGVAVADEPYVSDLAMTRRIKRQQRGFEMLLDKVAELPKYHREILMYLITCEGLAKTLNQMAPSLGYSASTLLQHPPLSLVKLKLISRERVNKGYRYQSAARQFLSETYPDLDSDELVRRLVK